MPRCRIRTACNHLATSFRCGRSPARDFERMVAHVSLGKVGAVAAREVSRFARNSRDWQRLTEMCRVVDSVLIDQETVYAPTAARAQNAASTVALQAGDFGMPSRQQVKVHINRALRAHTVEQKLDEIANAIGELARYVEDIEKDKLSRSRTG